MTNRNQLNIGVLLYGCGHHQAAWLMPDSKIEEIGESSYYQRLAQIAESGYLDAVFFADNQSFPAANATDLPAFWLDPLINLTAISQVTNHIGLVSTISSTFSNPYTAARQLLSLDHVTNGRVGWNLVTSMTDWEALNHNMDALPTREERYKKAEEFAILMEKLFLSWDQDDFLSDRLVNRLIDPEKIQPIHHTGTYFSVKGPLSTPRSPQGKPVAMQAGASEQGIALASRHADAVYSVSWNFRQAHAFREKLQGKIKQTESPNRKIKIYPGLVTYVGKTREEALAKKAELDEKLPFENALKQLSFFLQQDCSTWDLEAKIPVLPSIEEFSGPIGRYQTILEIIEDTDPTLKELLGYLAAGGGHLTLIGTPAEIADQMGFWFNEGVADGFNLMPPSLPSSLEDFVDMIVPELQKRGLFREAYQGTTLREYIGLDNPL
ncbi:MULTISPECIES: LLM class flavin-dependent oxidoreductase [Exiguobacterium]|uniref:LLM class flavin-dependent oxidoreductase n=1 Tax=Exiguobacterium TaxID=33986 RepID=UPI001BEB817B|nr:MULTISPECIES: LLM class flavin-dependent oxidoreductase [Exiguobacterium]MCT4791048.1 LLM class flavin-dependent oxidoreductase [Exiguobacterium artemiae]